MKFGLLFAHQVPPESGIASQDTYRDMLRCLPRAEELGYVSAFQCSHHVQKDGFCPGPLVAMAGAAAVTERMRIGTAVLLVPLYAPLKLAEDIAVIDNLSGGRFVFGVAPGYVTQEFAAHGVPREERVGRFEEALDLMIQAWTGEPFSFEGRYYRVPEGRVTPRPVQDPHPPIWYGVSAPGSLRRAAARRCVQIMSPPPRARRAGGPLPALRGGGCRRRLGDSGTAGHPSGVRRAHHGGSGGQGRAGGGLPLPRALWRRVSRRRPGAQAG